MSVQINTPPMASGTAEQRLSQLNNYLYQMAQQLQWAFDNVATSGAGQAQSLPTGGPAAPGGSSQGGTPQAQTPQEVFAGIKNLIIKSADIVNAYTESIGKNLQGVYVSDSEFGEYREATSSSLRATDKAVEQLYTSTQEISGTLDSLYDQVTETSAYIKTGYLGDSSDGAPIYGVEVGQKNSVEGKPTFDKFARFTPGRLSFYDESATEVAYISDYKMYITNAEITGALQLSGTFKVFYNNGLAFQWIGGGGALGISR